MKTIISKDGSFTLYSKQYDEHYHSINDGAFTESLQKHIIPAFNHIKKLNLEEVNFLDICFGLGYNTLVAIYYNLKMNLNLKMNFYSPELDDKLIASLKDYKYPKELEIFQDIITQLSNNKNYKSKNINIEIKIIDAHEYCDILYKKNIKIDIVFQDAFSVKKNPSLWTADFFKSIKNISSNNIILTTYTKTPKVRDALKINNFFLYEHKGENVRKSVIATLNDNVRYKNNL